MMKMLEPSSVVWFSGQAYSTDRKDVTLKKESLDKQFSIFCNCFTGSGVPATSTGARLLFVIAVRFKGVGQDFGTTHSGHSVSMVPGLEIVRLSSERTIMFNLCYHRHSS